MALTPSPFSSRGAGVRVRVRVTPKASRAEISGVQADPTGTAYLKVRVTAVPEKGEANAAVIKLLAKKWGLAPRDISVVSGETSRTKTLEILGDATSLLRDLHEWLKQHETGVR